MVLISPHKMGGGGVADFASAITGGGRRRRRRRSQRGGTTHTATAPAAPASALPAALPAGLNMDSIQKMITSLIPTGSASPPIKGGGRTRRLKRRLGKARRYSAKSHSAGGGKRRKTRRTRKHRR